MTDDLSLILKIQDLDLKTVELEREIAALPKRIGEIERQLDQHKKRLEVDRLALAANHKERKICEDDIKVQNQKISKLKDQTLSAKTNEQYRAFQHEIEFCEKEIRKYEDRILELMSQAEPLDQNVKTAEVALASEVKQVDAEKKGAREKSAASQHLLQQLKAERVQAAAGARKDFYSNYERLRRRTPIVVTEALDGCCSACHMLIRPAVQQQLRENAVDIIFCESCKRILFYNPPVSVEQTV